MFMHTKERCWGCAHNENRQDGVSARADLIIINERGLSTTTSKQMPKSVALTHKDAQPWYIIRQRKS